MKRILGFSILGCFALFVSQAHAVKAKPGLIEYLQPDGSTATIMLHGDEHFNYATSPDGLLLLFNEEGGYEYAVKSPSGAVVSSGVNATHLSSEVKGATLSGADYIKLARPAISPAKRMITSGYLPGEPKYRFSTAAFPTSGRPHTLVILVEYQDYRFNVDNPLEYFEDFLNGDEFRRDDATGSVRQYYIENSMGQFQPTFDVYGPVLLKNNRKYYGGGDERYAYQMVTESVAALDDSVDFSIYDHNEDGYVDNVYIIYADTGQADGGGADAVWPYSWELESEGVYLVADGVKFNSYGCSNEITPRRKMAGIGTFTHEFGHVLGLPDLYNTVNSYDMTTPTSWSVMDNGNYLNDSRTPCNFSSFERYSLGWLSPEEILCSGDYSLGPLPATNKAYIMTTEANTDEFYIADYRVQEGWDTALPSEGMLFWHVQFVQRVWDENEVNNNMYHQFVELVRADDMAQSNSLMGDPFPGHFGITEFVFGGKPSLQAWDGSQLNVTALTDIREEEGEVKFHAQLSEERGESGIGDLIGEESGFRVDGRTIISITVDSPVFDIFGRKVASLVPGKSVSLSPGIYIIRGQKLLL